MPFFFSDICDVIFTSMFTNDKILIKQIECFNVDGKVCFNCLPIFFLKLFEKTNTVFKPEKYENFS